MIKKKGQNTQTKVGSTVGSMLSLETCGVCSNLANHFFYFTNHFFLKGKKERKKKDKTRGKKGTICLYL